MTTLASSFLIGSSSFLQIIRSTKKSLVGFEIQPDQTLDCGFAALERLKNPHRLIMGEML